MKRFLVPIFLLIFYCGCGSTTAIKKPLDQSLMTKGENIKYEIGDIKSEVRDVPEHFIVALKGYLKTELTKNGLLSEKIKPSHRVDISVKYYRMRSGFTRAFFGVFAGKDGIDSIVSVTNLLTKEILAQSDVSSYNITALGGMEDIARMHAEEIAKFLAGKKE